MVQVSKKRSFIKSGLLYAELNCFFQKILSEEGYTGLEIRPRGACTDVVLMVTRTQGIIGEKGRAIRELTSLVQRKFGFDSDKIRLYVDKVQTRSMSAPAQCESLRFKLSSGIAVRKACYSVLRFVMENGALGCEVVVSGKIRGQRAKSMKFVDGVMIHSGNPVNDHVDFATRHVLLKQGVLGIKVKINKPTETGGPQGTRLPPLPDHVHILASKDESTAKIEPRFEDHDLKKNLPPPFHHAAAPHAGAPDYIGTGQQPAAQARLYQPRSQLSSRTRMDQLSNNMDNRLNLGNQ